MYTKRKFKSSTQNCCICKVKTSTHCFQPCGHKNICESCASDYRHKKYTTANFNKCPRCQTEYEDIINSESLPAAPKINTVFHNKNMHNTNSIPMAKNFNDKFTQKNNFQSNLKVEPMSTFKPNTGTLPKLAGHTFLSSQNSTAHSKINQSQPMPIVRMMSKIAVNSPVAVKNKSRIGLNNVKKGEATIIFTETVNAHFTGTDWTEGYENLLGKVTINYEKDDIATLQENLIKHKTYKICLFKIKNLKEIKVNDEWIEWLEDETVNDCYVYLIDVQKMLNLLQQKCAEEPSKKIFALKAFEYNINSLDKMKSCPLLLSCKWSSDNSKTRLNIKYKYNNASMASTNPLENVKISVHLSGFDEDTADPPAKQVQIEDNKVIWDLGNIHSRKSKGNILAKFETDDEATTGTVTAEFKSVMNSFSGIQFRASDFPIKDVKIRIFSGKYKCEANNTSDVPRNPRPRKNSTRIAKN